MFWCCRSRHDHFPQISIRQSVPTNNAAPPGHGNAYQFIAQMCSRRVAVFAGAGFPPQSVRLKRLIPRGSILFLTRQRFKRFSLVRSNGDVQSFANYSWRRRNGCFLFHISQCIGLPIGIHQELMSIVLAFKTMQNYGCSISCPICSSTLL